MISKNLPKLFNNLENFVQMIGDLPKILINPLNNI